MMGGFTKNCHSTFADASTGVMFRYDGPGANRTTLNYIGSGVPEIIPTPICSTIK